MPSMGLVRVLYPRWGVRKYFMCLKMCDEIQRAPEKRHRTIDLVSSTTPCIFHRDVRLQPAALDLRLTRLNVTYRTMCDKKRIPSHFTSQISNLASVPSSGPPTRRLWVPPTHLSSQPFVQWISCTVLRTRLRYRHRGRVKWARMLHRDSRAGEKNYSYSMSLTNRSAGTTAVRLMSLCILAPAWSED